MLEVKDITKYSDKDARNIFDAAQAMVSARQDNDTMNGAVDTVSNKHPEIPEIMLRYIWIGVNSKCNSLQPFS